MTDIWFAGVDEVLILRAAYTIAAVLGIPCALWCLWASLRSGRAVHRTGLNGWLKQAARGYQRRDVIRVFVLCLIASAGVIAVTGALPLRSVFGLVVLLTIALLLAVDGLCDFRERGATIDSEIAHKEHRHDP